MVSAIHRSPSLGDALVQCARRASMPRLILDVTGGVFILAVAVAWRPSGWAVLASAALCFATFGVSALADRLLDTSGAATNSGVAASLLILRTTAIAAGTVAALLVLFGAVGMAMGTWIS